MSAYAPRQPVVKPFEHRHYDFYVPKLLTITEQLASAENKKAELTEKFEKLQTQIKDVEELIEKAPDFETEINLIRRVKPPLKELEEKLEKELKEATNAVTELQKEKDAETVAQTKWNHERARENVMVNDAIEQAERDRLHKSIEQYNALLEKYQKAAMWLNHKNSKTPIPDGLLDDQWRLTDHELENTRLIDEKKWNLQSRYRQHFHGLDLNSIVKEYNDYHESVAARKPRSKSPTPTSRDEATGVKIMNENRKLLPPSTMTPIGQLNFWWRRKGGRRSKKKGKKCTRRHSKKKSTRRH